MEQIINIIFFVVWCIIFVSTVHEKPKKGRKMWLVVSLLMVVGLGLSIIFSK